MVSAHAYTTVELSDAVSLLASRERKLGPCPEIPYCPKIPYLTGRVRSARNAARFESVLLGCSVRHGMEKYSSLSSVGVETRRILNILWWHDQQAGNNSESNTASLGICSS